jgi:hypothetical protein
MLVADGVEETLVAEQMPAAEQIIVADSVDQKL